MALSNLGSVIIGLLLCCALTHTIASAVSVDDVERILHESGATPGTQLDMEPQHIAELTNLFLANLQLQKKHKAPECGKGDGANGDGGGGAVDAKIEKWNRKNLPDFFNENHKKYRKIAYDAGSLVLAMNEASFVSMDGKVSAAMGISSKHGGRPVLTLRAASSGLNPVSPGSESFEEYHRHISDECDSEDKFSYLLKAGFRLRDVLAEVKNSWIPNPSVSRLMIEAHIGFSAYAVFNDDEEWVPHVSVCMPAKGFELDNSFGLLSIIKTFFLDIRKQIEKSLHDALFCTLKRPPKFLNFFANNLLGYYQQTFFKNSVSWNTVFGLPKASHLYGNREPPLLGGKAAVFLQEQSDRDMTQRLQVNFGGSFGLPTPSLASFLLEDLANATVRARAALSEAGDAASGDADKERIAVYRQAFDKAQLQVGHEIDKWCEEHKTDVKQVAAIVQGLGNLLFQADSTGGVSITTGARYQGYQNGTGTIDLHIPFTQVFAQAVDVGIPFSLLLLPEIATVESFTSGGGRLDDGFTFSGKLDTGLHNVRLFGPVGSFLEELDALIKSGNLTVTQQRAWHGFHTYISHRNVQANVDFGAPEVPGITITNKYIGSRLRGNFEGPFDLSKTLEFLTSTKQHATKMLDDLVHKYVQSSPADL